MSYNRDNLCRACAGSIMAMVAGAAALKGCSASVTPTDDGIVARFTIGNSTVTLTLDLAGIFRVQPGAVVRNVVDGSPFDEAPTDAPATGALRLRSSSITISPVETAKGVEASQVITGTASLRVTIDAPGADSPCDTGVELGTFRITVVDGVVTSVSEGLPLALASTSYFLGNNISMCLEMQTDFVGIVRISGLDVVFGPSRDELLNGGLSGNFDLRNTGAQAVHILAPGEDFDASNQLVSGLNRTKVVGGLSILDLVTFRAGRDGTVLDTATCPPVNQSDFYAIVEWNGVTLSCTQPVTLPSDPDEDPQPQACCLPPLPGYVDYGESYAVHCANIGAPPFRTVDDCRFFGGVPQGEGTTCDTLVCVEAFRACCFTDPDACSDLLYDDCVDAGGVPEVAAVHCDDDPCNDDMVAPPITPDEACCLDDGSCQDADPAACAFAGDTSQGPGSTCAATTCPQPEVLGGCCFDDTVFCFGEISEADCLASDGVFRDSCDPDPCPFACCRTDGTCTTGLSVEDCEAENGDVSPRGTTCDDVTCEQPVDDLAWVLSGAPVVNANNDRTTFVGGGAMPDWFGEARFEGKAMSFTVTASSIRMDDREVDHGFEYHDVTLTTAFDQPPSELTPGATVTLTVTASHSGTVSEGAGTGFQFWYSSEDVAITPDEVLGYYPWTDTFSGTNTKTYTFTVPAAYEGGTFEIYASWWNCPCCNVTWRFEVP